MQHSAQVTKVKLAQKQKEGIAEARSGRRTPVRTFRYHSMTDMISTSALGYP